ncbi:MAG: hypothetical protein ABIR79_11905 [Candidatus Binatia bacterium]
MAAKISHAVKTLIAERIDSIPELEALLLVRDDRASDWSPEEAGKRLYVSTLVATYILGILRERGFLAERDARYRYEPASSELADAVDQLAAAYARHLVAVTEIVHSKPSRNIRDFANAFRVRGPQ